MKITKVISWSENLDLTRPYTIAFQTIHSVENVFVYLETESGLTGIGAGAPAEFITGETMEACQSILTSKLEDLLLGQDIRLLGCHSRVFKQELAQTPAARAAVDIALHDIFSKFLGIPLVELLGKVYQKLPTSITIGIKTIPDALKEAEEYLARGFRILKIKTGESVEKDIELVHKLRERIGQKAGIRVDANQGYSVSELEKFLRGTSKLNIEFIEQPCKASATHEMRDIPEEVRQKCVADESLHSPSDALHLATKPQSFGIFNIKLMKCGGISPAVQIADIANLTGIDLMWGCMDESIVSISAALHTALASPATRYLDLDGSLDLARDVVNGGFVLKDGYLSVTNQSGLGVTLKKDFT